MAMMILLAFWSLLLVVVCRETTATAETTSSISATTTTLEEWRKDEHGMFLASSLEELRVFLQVAHQTASSSSWQDGHGSPSSPFSMTLTWVEDAECSVEQNDTVIQSIHAAVAELMMTGRGRTSSSSSRTYHHPPIPTLRWTISSSDVHSRLADVKHLLSDKDFDFTRTPGLLITTCNGTDAHTVHYSGSYHRIPATLYHYYDWLTVWSTSIYDHHHPQAAAVPAIALDLSKPQTFRHRHDVLAHWDQHYHHHVTVDDATSTVTTSHPLLLVYYHQDLSRCPTKQDAAAAMKQQASPPWNATVVQEEMKVFDLFAITVAGRRDRYFFYSYDCRPMVHVYNGGPSLASSSSPDETAMLLYQWERSTAAAETTLHTFLVQVSSDALITFHRELTYPIAMAHDIQIVALTTTGHRNLLDETRCRQWKRRNYSIICLLVAPNEYRLIAALPGLQPDRVVIVDAERRRHVQPPGEMDVDKFVETTLFTTTRTTTHEGESARQQENDADESTQSERQAGDSIQWIEGPDAVFPQRGIVVAVSRTCGHCQRMLAIFTRLEGLLQKLRWTEDFPLYVVDVTQTDVAQPLWLPTLYYDGAESPKRTFHDETEILEWVFSQMPDNEVEELQRRLL